MLDIRKDRIRRFPQSAVSRSDICQVRPLIVNRPVDRLQAGKAGIFMKLILAIVSNDDSGAVSSALTREGYSVTKLATTGGFLMAGNTTFISGVDDEKVDDVIGIIAKYSSRRTQIVPSTSTMDVGMYSSFPVEVTVGGSTIFVLNVDRFEKV